MPATDEITISEAARILGCSAQWVRTLCDHRTLTARIVGDRKIRYFRRSEVERVAKERQNRK